MHLIVFVEVQPGAVRARLSVDAVGEDPRVLFRIEEHARLALREQLIVDSDVAVRRSSNRDTLFDILALLVVVDFACVGATENLQLKLDGLVVQVDVEVGWDVQLLLLIRTCDLIVDVGLQVLVLSHQAAHHDINDYVRLANVD